MPKHRPLSSSSSSSFSSKFTKIPPLQTLLKSGFTPTVKSINKFLYFLTKTRRPKLIIHFFSQMKSNQFSGNSQTHSFFTWALLKSHHYEEAEHFMKTQMVKASNFPRDCMWDSLIQGFCIHRMDPEKALLVLQDCLRNLGTLPSSFTFCSLIHRLCSQGDMSKVIEVLELMTDERVKYPFNNFVCSLVISGFCKIGKPELAVGFFENAISSGAIRSNVVTYTALVGALCKSGRVSEVNGLVRRMEKEGVAFDAVFYSSWICGYISEGDLMEMFRRKKQMVEKGISPDNISYAILINGLSKLGDVEKAAGFLKKMSNDGLEPNLVTFTAIMLGFCEKGKLEEAFSFLKILEDLRIELDEFVYATLIHGCCRKGDFNRVFCLLNEMEKRGINPSNVTYNTMINGLCKFGRTSEAVRVSKSIRGDTITYTTLLHGYIREENIPGILETKKRFEEAGVCMDVVMCNVLLKALFMVGAFEDASLLYKGMLEMDLFADSVTYCTMIDGYCKVGRIHEAIEIFADFRRTSISSVACYNCIITGLCTKGMVDMAIEMFIKLNEKGLALDAGIYMILMKAIFKERGAAGVSNLVFQLENMRLEVSDLICNNAISFLCKRGHPEVAVKVFMIMRMQMSILTSKSYYLLIKQLIAHGRKRLGLLLLNKFLKEYGLIEPRLSKILAYYLCLENVSSALFFLDKMKDSYVTIVLPLSLFKTLIKDGRVLDVHKLVMKARGNLPVMDVFDYSKVVDSLCKRGYISEALDVCEFAKCEGIALNIICYNSIINGLCRQGCLVEAFQLFDSLERIGLAPSEITYGTLIDALCREGFLLDAKKLFEKMVLIGSKPNTHVYNSLIDGYCKIGQVEEALKLIDDLEVKCLKPDEFTVSALINACCRKGDLEGAVEFFRNFKRKGISPDFLGFMYIIRGLCGKGRMEEAMKILREMLDSQSVIELLNRVDIELETDSHSLLDSLRDHGNIVEAVTVLNGVGSIFYPACRWSHAYHDGSHMLHKLYDGETFGTVNSKSVTFPNKTDLSFGFSDMKNVNKQVKNSGHVGSRSLVHDFDSYYSRIASLCLRGELQEASQLAKKILS
ncbi:pentatricopeptide repeat-containing protein At5g57250, mitochondrial [Ziziphus jujuba]|uniref:Pentatricopeptide repeat-containing protein At5g57250, mitochondrial n=1 Tax=Ziziphus jujuba TaxID=326968 RepID=A0ABM3IQ11_ZIZJJ|nr:pentatricopeptide repeat-containing protein At5g57250, mitochondrial [Ziziphus jujuba]XP_048333097.2 pentatricopeptide repeat-containing protein At5g57250, mitochondrial [Ziziphus jujuba]XP_048333098.2 pentatricopeptide repeat-containing protein At5g57250, mitochondrial [Ziziphus jujuba]XP_048333103.2 pentatricopeptide repeat-containing protein At5g57250, mitochondrial [Ziziphus jujuba]XP_048333109.2 pentatricopeptide repeat-containing protein At5g57250, mitochondrial [Ziziphus jujuba]